jgi:hypothetical protein
MSRPYCVICPSSEQTRFLLYWGKQELLRATLPPPSTAHSRAAALLLEGMSLWLDQRLSVVICADAPETSSALGLCDGFGFGNETVYYSVEIVEPKRRRGLGSFRDLRQLRFRGFR